MSCWGWPFIIESCSPCYWTDGATQKGRTETDPPLFSTGKGAVRLSHNPGELV